jgi:pyridoxal phosphate-dependent aminotransferase EpsN
VAAASRDEVLDALTAEGIEGRPVWKPMHLQPAYAGTRSVGGAVAARLFETGLCLPSGSVMSDDEVDEVAATVRAVLT